MAKQLTEVEQLQEWGGSITETAKADGVDLDGRLHFEGQFLRYGSAFDSLRPFTTIEEAREHVAKTINQQVRLARVTS